MMRFVICFVSFAIAFGLLNINQGVAHGEEPAKTTVAPDPRFSRDTPEGTLRLAMLGIMLGNEKLISSTVVPLEPEEMKLVTKPVVGAPPLADLKKHVAAMEVRTLKVGDKFMLPGNNEITVPASDVNDEQMVLVYGNAPTPTRMYKAQGHWWADIGPIIAARRAAAKAREESKPSP